MPLVDAWKKAKTEFETTTGKKKPSDKFLGVFRKGAGLESSIKAIDSAKTGKDLTAALAKFSTAYTDYVKQLEKAAADPTSVKTADKPAYIAAIKKLQTELNKIEQDGERMAESMQGVGAKEKVDSSVLKECNDHIALRLKVAKDCAALLQTLKNDLAGLNNRLGLVEKQVSTAQAAAKSSNTMGHQVAVGVIDRHIDEATDLFEKDKAMVADFTKEGSEMMKARGDRGNVYDKLPASIKKEMETKRNAAWGPVTQQAAEQNTIVQQMQAAVEKMKAAKAKAEGSGNQMKSPDTYVSELKKLTADIEKAFKDVTIKSDRVVKALAEFDAKIKSYPDAVTKEKHCKLQEDQWARYGPETRTVRERIGSMKTQATSLPKGATENTAVKNAQTAAIQAADDAIKTLGEHLKAGEDLEKKIATARQSFKK